MIDLFNLPYVYTKIKFYVYVLFGRSLIVIVLLTCMINIQRLFHAQRSLYKIQLVIKRVDVYKINANISDLLVES